MNSGPLRILILGEVIPGYPPVGGTRIVPFQLAEALARAGNKVDYLAVAPRGSRKQMEHANPLYLSLEPGSLAYPNGLLFPLYQYLKTFRRLGQYDIIHCEAHLAAFYGLHRVALGSPPKLVAAEYTPAIPEHFWQRRSFFEPYRLAALRLADLVICPCDYSRSNVHRAYGVPLSKSRPLHGGVHQSFLAPTLRRRGSAGYTLLFCGRLNSRRPHKTLDVLLRAMPRLLDRHRVRLDIVGGGPRLEEYVTLSRTLGIEHETCFVGNVDHCDLPAHYATADLFVLPSARESFPLVLLEAMATGLPVVATAVGGIPEMVVHGETGLLVPPNDPQALAQAINSLLDDPEAMRTMGATGRQRAKEFYTWDKVALRMEHYFREVL